MTRHMTNNAVTSLLVRLVAIYKENDMDYYLEVTYKNGQTECVGPLDLRRACNMRTAYEYTNEDVTGCTVIDEVTYHAIQESGPWDC